MSSVIKKIERRARNFLSDFLSFFKKERLPYSEFVRLFTYYNGSKKAPDVLFLGDSVAERVSWSDANKRTLSQILLLKLKDVIDIAVISYGGFTLKVFYYFTLALEKMDRKPGLVIFPINIRNFSPQWDLEPNWQFKAVVTQIKKFIEDPSIVPPMQQTVEEIPESAFNEFDAIKVDYPLSPLDHIGQFRLLINSTPTTEEQRKFRLRQIFIFHYTNILTPDHPKILFLLEMMKMLQKMQIPFITYITPVNFKAGEAAVGRSFSEILRANVRVVFDLIHPYCVDGKNAVRDWSEQLGPEYFFHPDNATEHLNEFGRDVLASLIADEVKNFLKNGI